MAVMEKSRKQESFRERLTRLKAILWGMFLKFAPELAGWSVCCRLVRITLRYKGGISDDQ